MMSYIFSPSNYFFIGVIFASFIILLVGLVRLVRLVKANNAAMPVEQIEHRKKIAWKAYLLAILITIGAFFLGLLLGKSLQSTPGSSSAIYNFIYIIVFPLFAGLLSLEFFMRNLK
jgi:hypothetical protein